jgi:uncharacterized cupredoxin-like copper-binding protein
MAAGLLVFGVACGGGDEENEPAATEEEDSTEDEGTEEEAAEEETSSAELEFIATEFAFAGPEAAPAEELTITLTNNGEQVHVMAAVPLKEGAPSVEELADVPEKELEKYAAGQLSGTLKKPVEPGNSETFTIDASKAATVGYICYIEDPKTKKPHFALGMLGSITIE